MGNLKPQLFTITNGLLVVIIVVLWVQFIAQDYSSDPFKNTGIQSTQSRSIKATNAPIESYHIFGSAKQLYDVPLAQGVTTLDFVLNGTMSLANGKAGFAYITNVQGKQEKFKIGEKVFSIAVLKEVYKNYVILEHNGKNERLALPESPRFYTKSSKNKKSNPITNPAFLKHLNGGQQKNWQQMMEQQKYDPNRIAKIVGKVNLVTDQTGQIQGLRVSNLAQGDLLTKSGLRSNDIITAINGNKVSAKNMLSIQKTLEQNPNATITINRNGKKQDVKININNL